MWVADVHSNDIIPRGYDLSTPLEIQAFIDDFRIQKAEGWLKSVYKKLTGFNYTDSDDGYSFNVTGMGFCRFRKSGDLIRANYWFCCLNLVHRT